jgi:hypothetical protein
MRKQGTTTLAAGATSGNVLAGEQIQYPERPSRVTFAAASSATGIVGTVKAGSRELMSESHVSPANRFPVQPDDVMVKDVAMPGQLLSMVFRNPTAGALTVQWSVDSDPIA